MVFSAERCLSLSAIISITEIDNRLLDRRFGKLKRFPTNDFSSNFMQHSDLRAQNRSKYIAFLQNFPTLCDVTTTSSSNCEKF